MKSWGLFFALIQVLYQFYHILCLADMHIRGMDKLKYYIAHACWLLEDGLQNVVAPWNHLHMAIVDLQQANMSKEEITFLKDFKHNSDDTDNDKQAKIGMAMMTTTMVMTKVKGIFRQVLQWWWSGERDQMH